MRLMAFTRVMRSPSSKLMTMIKRTGLTSCISINKDSMKLRLHMDLPVITSIWVINNTIPMFRSIKHTILNYLVMLTDIRWIVISVMKPIDKESNTWKLPLTSLITHTRELSPICLITYQDWSKTKGPLDSSRLCTTSLTMALLLNIIMILTKSPFTCKSTRKSLHTVLTTITIVP